MIYVRFHPDIPHVETCGFEQYNVELKSMGECGANAIGYTGGRTDSRVFLCRAHFDRTRAIAGVHDSDVQLEEKK